MRIRRFKKPIAAFLLLVFTISSFSPIRVYALTSGPEQPEMKGFQPVGINDLVDLFTGDFHYSIPLMDVGGYPLNLSYNAGQTMDDESSWVGFGWNLNPGAVNRQLRGIPDDFDGTGPNGDVIEKQVAVKPFISKSISPVLKFKRKGKPFPNTKVRLSANLGITHDNYTGVKAEIGFNASLSLTKLTGTSSTLNLGISSDNQNGGSFKAQLNLPTISKRINNSEFSLNSAIGFSYNATRGLEGYTILGPSFSQGIKGGRFRACLDLTGNEQISFAGESYIPAVETPQRTKTFSYALRAGGTALGFTGVVGVSGSYTKQDIASGDMRKFYPAYGMMYTYEAKNNNSVIKDVQRENDRPYHKSLPYLPVPVINNDLFTVTSQNSSGQYRVVTSSSGIFSESSQRSKSTKFGFGLELAFGYVFHIGIPELSYNHVTNHSGKWTNKNDFKTNGEFVNTSNSDPSLPEVYFKKIGETAFNEASLFSKIGNKEAARVQLRSDTWAKTFGRGTALNKLRSKSGREYTDVLQKIKQDKRNETFSYLKAGEAQYYALDKNIQSYPLNTVVVKGCNENLITTLPRVGGSAARKENHISEITVTDQGGARQVYGIPAYNIRQDEVSFSIKADEDARKKGLIRYNALDDSLPLNDDDPRMTSKDYIYHFSKQRIRGYANSYLLTGILSPDYVDVTGNGISDDDLGTGIKFNYSKIGEFKWRTPFSDINGDPQRVANYNEGLLTDKKDDKVNYAYGEREQWYLHSIESKTMLALFVLEDRDDALGVNNSDGSLNSSFKLKKLKEIRLYSKADLYKNRNDFSLAIPIKIVHFEYSYELFNNVPNSIAANDIGTDGIPKGKLTLKKVYFTFYQNGEGKLHPYTFNYNIPAYQDYQFRQYDRWGMYKPADSTNRNGLTNAEFPYATQDKTSADRWAGYWQLSQVNLPSGGTINITYESDDYAYVQNKRASIMCFMKGVGGLNQNNDIIGSNTIYAELPQPVASGDVKELKEKYFEGMDYLYFKSFVDLDNQNTNYEFIPGYAKIKTIEFAPGTNNGVAKITVEKVDGYNPISKAAWQILQNSLPKLAYSEYNNLDNDESDVVKAVRAMLAAISRIPDIVRSFDSRASHKKFANRIDLNKSWVRLCSPDFKKLGGGGRVKKITMSDKWSEMTGNANTETATYGQAYYYTTEKTLSNGQTINISSGVACYEPQIGGDENPFKLPIQYTQKRFLGLDQHYYVEQPLCETYFPAPSVGYSKVTMKNIGADGVEGTTGSTTSEFFTAKDFPTRVEATDLQRIQPILRKIFRLFSVKMTDHATVSQGYVVENYNMHGKQKSERVIDKNNQEISAAFYQYKTDNSNSGKPTLNNVVPIMNKDGSLNQATLGVDYDFYTDMNEHSTENFGAQGEPSGGFYFLGIVPKPWFYWGGFSPNYDKRLFRSAVAIKTINSFPILEKVIKVEKGSRIETENLLWDGETGEVLLTKTQNEFDDPIYSFTYPAYWAYDGMGPAYQNQGLYLTNFTSNSNGVISNYGSPLLAPGDELIIVTTNSAEAQKFWIIKAADNTFRVVNEDGVVSAISNKTVKILRSGRKNLSSSSMGSVVSLRNPVVGNKLRVDALTQILDAKAAVFSEEWALPVKLKCGCPPGYYLSSQGFCYLNAVGPSGCPGYPLCKKPNNDYTSLGTRIYDVGFTSNGWGTYTACGGTSDTLWKNVAGTTAQGPLNRCGVWHCSNWLTNGPWIGKSVLRTVPDSKYYYIGVAGDNYVRLKVDGQIIVQFGNPGPNGEAYSANFRRWHVYPVFLTAGAHFFEICGKNVDLVADFGFEVYNNTVQQLQAAHVMSDLNIIVSSAEFVGTNTNVYDNSGNCITCQTNYAYNPNDNLCYQLAPPDPNSIVFNPYKAGVLGNWQTQRSYAFDVSRTNFVSDPTVVNSTNIRKAGYYSAFDPYWISNGTNFQINSSGFLYGKWIWGNEVTQFNSKGVETENKDALLRYSAAQTAYLQSLPVAVAANAKLRDIAFDGFEDYDLLLQCSSDTCNIYPGHFNFLKILNGNTIKTDTTYAHTGNYSLKLNTTAVISRSIYGLNDTLYKRDNKQQYYLNSNYPMKGFSPSLAGQKYILSFWVRDNNNSTVSPSLDVYLNGSSMFTGSSYKAAMVEGWKRIETSFIMPTGSSFSLSFVPYGTVYIDDVRIFPFDGQMKSFVYDASSLRLMAELDENNFASFYEYDDQGILTRVKKETEKGIMTIRESRTGIKKTN
jgi:hypothetical protein